MSEDYSVKLPNTLIIGVQKAATTWLAKRLSQHPDIYMVPGEVHYFDHEEKYSKGVKWYSSLFEDSKDESIRCEKSGAYFWTTCNGVSSEPQNKPERISQLIPEAKLIVILRNPTDRAISGWNHNVRSGAISPKLDINKIFSPDYAEIINQHGILTRGLYHQQLSEYLKYFKREQILVLFFETDIIQSPDVGLKKVLNFLGLSTDFAFSDLSKAENKLKSTRVGVLASHYAFNKAFAKLVYQLDRRLLSKLPFPKWSPAFPNMTVRNELAHYYREENVKLANLVGSLPKEWELSKSSMTAQTEPCQ